MYKKASRILIIVFMLSMTLFISNSLNASAKTESKNKGCHHQNVELRGSQSPRVTCLDASGAISPNIATNCNNAQVILWLDSNYSGNTICFEGSGFANLTDFFYCNIGFCSEWNDRASSYEFFSAKASDYFAIDINGNGQRQYLVNTPLQANFDGAGGRLPNDTMSSIYLS